jgi:hypothetical protein
LFVTLTKVRVQLRRPQAGSEAFAGMRIMNKGATGRLHSSP